MKQIIVDIGTKINAANDAISQRNYLHLKLETNVYSVRYQQTD